MSWENLQVTFYKNHWDTTGEPATLRDVLYWKFGDSLDTIIALRQLDPSLPDYEVRKKKLKDTLPGFTPSALLGSREKGNVVITERTGIIQFDFDDCYEYDIDELKRALIALPFVCWVGLSCSGNGIYALVTIAEPERQRAYVEHCFQVFEHYGLKPDRSKGRNAHDLRYVSYDSRPVWKDNPEPLRIKYFKPQQQPKKTFVQNNGQFTGSRAAVVKRAIDEISGAQAGQRWQTVQKWAFTMGGLQDGELLKLIDQAIEHNPAFGGLEAKYMRCAHDCFEAGRQKPLPQVTPSYPKF